MNAIQLNLFASRIDAICDEMGAVLRRTAFSPNIKDRLDFSCALFDARGELCAQAAHIPVHLGSMAFAMHDIVSQFQWRDGDVLILNDPYLGGTHLPDVTMVAPVFIDDSAQLLGFVANRAHHANIGCETPGSMPVSSTLEEEGVVIPPTLLILAGELQADVVTELNKINGDSGLTGDFAAQVGAINTGKQGLLKLIGAVGSEFYRQGLGELNDYADRLAHSGLVKIKRGVFSFRDVLDDDAMGTRNITIAASLDISESGIKVDFSGSDDQVRGNVNCPLSVTAAAVFYVFRCLMPDNTPACAGAFRRIQLIARPGSVVHALRPAAVAAGNVETSTRIVDVILGALAKALPDQIPAASQGSMNNLAIGYHSDTTAGGNWDYYETIAGGMGAGPSMAGLHGVQTHMTNTLNTPVESLETHYPLRVRAYHLRIGSGGQGLHNGGDGLVREIEFLQPSQVTLLTERRTSRPWGLMGGEPGKAGENTLNGKVLPAKCSFEVHPGDRLRISTPGGGGYGVQRTEDEGL